MKVTAKMKRNAPALAKYWAREEKGHVKKHKKHGRVRRFVAHARRAGHRVRAAGHLVRGGVKMAMLAPITRNAISLGTAYGWGMLEKQAKADKESIYHKVPEMVSSVGAAGNAALLAFAIGTVTHQPTLVDVSLGLGHVALYQNARGPGFAEKQQDFSLGGPAYASALSPREAAAKVDEYLRARARSNGE